MKEYKLTVKFHNGPRYCYYGKTKREALAAFKKSFGSFKGFVKKRVDDRTRLTNVGRRSDTTTGNYYKLKNIKL